MKAANKALNDCQRNFICVYNAKNIAFRQAYWNYHSINDFQGEDVNSVHKDVFLTSQELCKIIIVNNPSQLENCQLLEICQKYNLLNADPTMHIKCKICIQPIKKHLKQY